MIIRPDSCKVEKLYQMKKEESKELAKKLMFVIPFILCVFPVLMMIVSNVLDDVRDMDFDDIMGFFPVCIIMGAVLGYVAKNFAEKFLIKNSASLISQIKNSGVKLEEGMLTGKMMKPEQQIPGNNVQQVLPNKTFDVTFKISNINNITIEDKVIGKVNYGKYCTLSVGADKYYLMCLDDNEAVELRNYIMNYTD